MLCLLLLNLIIPDTKGELVNQVHGGGALRVQRLLRAQIAIVVGANLADMLLQRVNQ